MGGSTEHKGSTCLCVCVCMRGEYRILLAPQHFGRPLQTMAKPRVSFV